MSRGSDWNDDDGPPFRRRGFVVRGRAVTGVGLISLIVGGLGLLGSAFNLLFALDLRAANNVGGAIAAPGFITWPVDAILISALVASAWGFTLVVSGVGVLRRREWARIMVLVLSVLGAEAGLYFLWSIRHFDAFGGAAFGIHVGPDNPGARSQIFMINLVVPLALIGHCIWSFVVLLHRRNEAEFS